ncbi:S8 family peptidase [Anaeromicropila herbilytica]|uniref:Peptidase S8/S53 domain-containing protein n=1 Tax=Anaeromicropila herbilytica TaxID=2785025 RepID=A0A7R7IE30_9FIRM|nr:S8 family peptidase [Anaeromicropila herbilytica]BCN30653.1 hypothetical protein bsdtb5_19480 [Anaeromicropila herbilytica]
MSNGNNSSNENQSSVNKLLSNDYIDIIVEYSGNLNYLKKFGEGNYTIIDETFAMVHLPGNEITQEFIRQYGWTSLPYLGGIQDTTALEASGITKLQNIPKLSLRGQGTLIGILDTGIDYTNEVFKNADNTTKIVSIWDQTIQTPGKEPEGFYYGTEYTREQINDALKNPNPYDIVPSRDDNGHGTQVAGIAAGSPVAKADFVGVAPDSELIIVKLRYAKKVYRDYFFIPENALCYQTTDPMFAVQYIAKVAEKLARPYAILFALGTSQGAHDGRGAFARTLGYLSRKVGTGVIIAAGNEGNRGSHYYGVIDKNVGYDVVELNVGENSKGFTMELWGTPPNLYSVDILSPSGEYIPRISAKIRESREIKFLFESTVLYLEFQILDEQTGNERILFRFKNPTKGIWRIRIYGTGNLSMSYHIWLPIKEFLDSDTFFVKPDQYTTITSPGNTSYPITVTAYSHTNNSLYTNASRGFTALNQVKPEIAAPGVNIYCPTLNNQYTRSTGSSIAAAQVAGVSALLLEWGIIKKNYERMDTLIIKRMLIGGAKRDPNSSYPNRDWGYGILDLYNTFLTLRGE